MKERKKNEEEDEKISIKSKLIYTLKKAGFAARNKLVFHERFITDKEKKERKTENEKLGAFLRIRTNNYLYLFRVRKFLRISTMK